MKDRVTGEWWDEFRDKNLGGGFDYSISNLTATFNYSPVNGSVKVTCDGKTIKLFTCTGV